MFWILSLLALIITIALFERYKRRLRLRAPGSETGGRQYGDILLGKMLAGGAPPSTGLRPLPDPATLPVDEQALAALRQKLEDGGVAEAGQIAPLLSTPEGMVWTLAVPGRQAIALWNQLRALVPETGHWPVVLGDAAQAGRIYDVLAVAEENTPDSTPDGILAGSESVRMPDWFRSRRESVFEDAGSDLEEMEGTWPSDPGASIQFTIPTDILSAKPLPEVLVALVPTASGWQVPALLRWGGWNDCPAPAEHAAALRYWNDRYGAELVGMSADVIEMQVARPPATREEALELAWQQFGYCHDIVTQGTETLAPLAATLLDSKVWYFWWD